MASQASLETMICAVWDALDPETIAQNGQVLDEILESALAEGALGLEVATALADQTMSMQDRQDAVRGPAVRHLPLSNHVETGESGLIN